MSSDWIVVVGMVAAVVVVSTVVIAFMVQDQLRRQEPFKELAAQHGWAYRFTDVAVGRSVPGVPMAGRPSYRHVMTGRYRGHEILVLQAAVYNVDPPGPDECWHAVAIRDLPPGQGPTAVAALSGPGPAHTVVGGGQLVHRQFGRLVVDDVVPRLDRVVEALERAPGPDAASASPPGGDG